MASYLILGGGVGKAIAYYLDQQKDTKRIVILDKDKSVLEISRILPVNSKCDFMIGDIDEFNLVELFQGFDVIISAMPASKNLILAKKSIQAGKPFCDLGGIVDITKMQISQLHELALSYKVSVIPDCGLMPGLGILMAKKLVCETRNTESIIIYVGGMPQKPRPPVYYQRVFNEHGLASICYDSSPVLVDGKIRHLPPFSGYEKISVVELKKFSEEFNGQIEAFITAGASVAPWTFKRMGIKNFSEKTVRWPGFVDFVKDIPRDKFIGALAPHISIPVTEDNPDLVWMEVEAISHERSDKPRISSYSLLDTYDPHTNITAMERTTGFPTAIIARMIANKQSAIGVNTPETALDERQLEIFWKEVTKCIKIKKFDSRESKNA